MSELWIVHDHDSGDTQLDTSLVEVNETVDAWMEQGANPKHIKIYKVSEFYTVVHQPAVWDIEKGEIKDALGDQGKPW